MKINNLSLLCTIMFVLLGCNTHEPADILSYREVPAIYSKTALGHMLETRAGTFLAPQLGNLSQPLNDGDLLLINFEINLLNQPYSDIKTVSNLSIILINSILATQIGADEISEFNDPIKAIVEFDVLKNYPN